MKVSGKRQQLLKGMAAVERMERGKLCLMTGRPHYNHQTWYQGRNIVRYVPASEVASLQEAIDGYALFCNLAEQYADEVIEQTRRERAKSRAATKTPSKKRTQKPRTTAKRVKAPP